MLGKETIDSFNHQREPGRADISRPQLSEIRKGVDDPGRNRRDGRRQVYLQVRGMRPFLSEKFDITRHPRYKYLADADKKNVFDVDRCMTATRRNRAVVKPKDDLYETVERD